MAREGINAGDFPTIGNYPSSKKLNSLMANFSMGGDEFAIDRRTREGKQMNRIFTGELNESDAGYQGAGEYYAPKSYGAAQTASETNILYAGGDEAAFVQKDIPTSSTNYGRPRTVAAGYDPERQTMTVVFRDGTFYNYYEVTQSEWDAFHASYSKGKPWLNKANKNQASDGLFIHKPRGDAGDMSSVDPAIREALYRVARSFQQKSPPKVGRTTQTAQMFRTSKAGKTYKYGKMPVQNAAKQNKSASRAHRPHTGK